MYVLVCGSVTFVCAQPVAVLTQHNDNSRTGANLKETILNTTNVNTNQFGLIFTHPVDDQIYAQPLIMTNVNIPGHGVRNVVYVATVNDSVYAFDADDASAGAPYWQVSFLGPNVVAVRNTDMTGACGGNYHDFSGAMGIVSTPVIDPVAGTIYVVARTKENGSTFVQRLHALDVRTGAEQPNSPVDITATYPGTGSGSSGGFIAFNSQRQNQRAALALVNGIVYVSWASHCDWGPYHGWVIGFDASLQQAAIYNVTPNGTNAGIWMSGQAPSADANGNLYLSTGNGTVGVTGNPRDITNRGESFLKLTRSGTNLNVTSWFTPYNYAALEAGDIDLGSAGLLLIPGTTLALSGGKGGTLYLVNRDDMGGLSGSTTADTNIVQSIALAGFHEIHGGPVWWDGPDGSYAYSWSANSERLRQYKYDPATGMFLLPNYAQSTTVGGSGSPGGILAISANGTNAGSGVVWAVVNTTSSANQAVVAGTLHAYNAQNVTNELWNSDTISSRDALGSLAKFVAPTVANGKVYMATFSNRLSVYGLLPVPSLSIRLSAGNVILSWETNAIPSFMLQSNATVVAGTWQNVTNAPITTNGTFQLTLPAASAATFYRLKR